MTNEIVLTSVGADEETAWKRYIEFEYNGETYTGWLHWDIYDGHEWIGIYGDYELLFNQMGGYLDNEELDNLSYDFQQGEK
jgi:hypothetical protein